MDFSPVRLEDRPILHPIIRQWDIESSDSCFTNLFMWQNSVDIAYALDDLALYIRFCGEDQRCFFLPPILKEKNGDFAQALSNIIACMDARGIPFRMRGINERAKGWMEEAMPGRFAFVHERDTDDYVYESEKLINLSGKKFHGKRNHIKKFLSFYPYEYEPYDAQKHAEACLELNERWSEKKDDNEGFMSDDFEAMERALRYAKELELKGGVVYIAGKLEAFTLGEQITKDMALIHIEKANHEIQGLYPFINQHFVEQCWSELKYINREEDMGVENIRRAKESYYPDRMIEKYSAKII